MHYIKRSLAANSAENVAAVGNYIYYKFGNGLIHVETDKKEAMFLNPGDMVKTEQMFKDISIVDMSGEANNIELAITGTKIETLQRVGTIYRSNADVPQVTALTSVQVLPQNPKRLTAIISSNQPHRVTGAPGNPGPGFYHINVTGNFTAPLFLNTTDEIWCSAISAAAVYYNSEILVE